jgi:hypothetical protein
LVAPIGVGELVSGHVSRPFPFNPTDAGSVCGRGLSGKPFSTIGFECRRNKALQPNDVREFAEALLTDVPPPPADQAAIVVANRSGRIPTRA